MDLINPLWIIPFVVLLASIALMPFIHRHWWERYYPLVAVSLGAVASSYYWFLAPSAARWLTGMEEYVSFITLLWALYVVSGGIVIHVNRKATPAMNSVLLLTGAVIANLFGTTGASMLLIRPYLRMNRGHIRPYHVVFFIFLVSNVGGLLTPIGDPPLFLGYLKGVPFWWVLQQGRWLWLVAVLLLLATFYIIDRLDHGKSERHSPEDPGPAVSILGIHNLLFIALILWAVFQPGFFDVLHRMHLGTLPKSQALLTLALCREILMLAASLASILLTSKAIHHRNEFTYAPIREVGILFVGIFATMVPALQWLNQNAKLLPLQTPGQFYFTTGTLSSVLDNAPTYLTFLEAQLGKLEKAQVNQAMDELKKMADTGKLEVDPALKDHAPLRNTLNTMIDYHPNEIRNRTITRDEVEVAFLLGDPVLSLYILAISAGAVLFGACTYIGNGPNFMVKSIADAAGVQTPSFLGYILRFTLPILLPVYLLIWLFFLSPWF